MIQNNTNNKIIFNTLNSLIKMYNKPISIDIITTFITTLLEYISSTNNIDGMNEIYSSIICLLEKYFYIFLDMVII